MAQVPERPGHLTYALGLAKDVSKLGAAFCVLSTVRFIPPLKRRAIAAAEKKMYEEHKVISSYNEGLLMKSAFDNPCKFVQGIWAMKRAQTLGQKLLLGGIAPNPALLELSGETRPLYSFQGPGKYLVLNFGSQSCGCFAANVPKWNDIVSRFSAECDFLTVYCKEAHPRGGWEAPDQPNVVADARSSAERREAAKAFFAKAASAGQLAVDGIDNYATLLYNTLPDRLIVVDPTQHLVHVQEPGPIGYQPDELAEFLRSALSKQ